MLVYYKFYYIGPTNWYVTNEVIQYSFILLLKCYLIATSVCKLFVLKFVISLACSPHTHTHTKWINKNTIQSPLSVWKMLKLIQILVKKIYKLIWQEYDQCYLNNIIKQMFEWLFFYWWYANL